MNFNKFISSDYLKSNPLCGISTYKDTLNLSNGSCTRYVKKLVLDGTENWLVESGTNGLFTLPNVIPLIQYNNQLCTHFSLASSYVNFYNTDLTFAVVTRPCVLIHYNACKTVSAFKAFLASEYAAGHPVTIWYVLPAPTTETITVPSGLSGTEEGYLNQSGTPTPTNPIYPTANIVEKWFDINHYIMGTDTDTITTPADIYANDTTATVGLKGDMSQSSTPTPTNPIQPSECGERTGNLFDYSAITTGYRIQWINGATYVDDTAIMSDYIPVTEGDYTLNINLIIIGYAADKSYIGVYRSDETWEKLPSGMFSSFTVLSNTNVEFVRLLTYGTYDPITDALMLNSGSTALPYEPFGVKIPISSGNTTTPVYLGEVETTRKIRKLVFDGTEDWKKFSNSNYTFEYNPYSRIINGLCSHYAKYYGANFDKIDGIYLSNTNAFIITDLRFTTLTDFKAYLAAQYAAGTPVTVWYVLATPKTGILNEPLRKIGDYADTVSNVSIPTIAGANTISVDTTLQPSEVTVNYKGWHPVADVHERNNGAWT